MVLLTLYRRISSYILPCRALPRVCGHGRQHFRLVAPQRGTVPSQLPLSRLRLLRLRLHYRDRSWYGWKRPLRSLNQGVRNVGAGWKRLDGCPSDKGGRETEQTTEVQNKRGGYVILGCDM